MNDKQRAEMLENVLAQMLKPIKDIPFSTIIKSISGFSVVPICKANVDDKAVISSLTKAAKHCMKAVRAKPIIRPRPNEVGNDIEEYVKAAVIKAGLKCERPRTVSGKLKSTGYPDLLVYDAKNRPIYLECKIYSAGTKGSTMRSFYLSPSEDFKVGMDARHLLIAFGMVNKNVAGTRNSEYTATEFKLVDLRDLLCDVKNEFNSDNIRLYGQDKLLASGCL